MYTGVTVEFEHTTYSVDEGNVVEVCVVHTGTIEKSLEVFVSSSSESATGIYTLGIVVFSQDYYQCSHVTQVIYAGPFIPPIRRVE